MTKPWQEEWGVGGYGDLTVRTDEGTYVAWARRIEPGTVGDVIDQRNGLASAAPELVRALLAVEWGGESCPGERICPSCGQAGEHSKYCALDAALRKAGVR